MKRITFLESESNRLLRSVMAAKADELHSGIGVMIVKSYINNHQINNAKTTTYRDKMTSGISREANLATWKRHAQAADTNLARSETQSAKRDLNSGR